MNDEPGNCETGGSGFNVEPRRVPFDVVQHVGVEGEHLTGSRILNISSAGRAPGASLRSGPALDLGYGGPGDECPHSLVGGRLQNGDAAAARVTDHTQAGRLWNAETSGHEGVHHAANVLELRAESVMAESLGQGEIPGVIHAAAAQVGADDNKARLGQPFGQGGEHAPIFESL